MSNKLNSLVSQKQATRQFFRQQRNALTKQQQQDAAEHVLQTCLTSTALAQAKIVAAYIQNDGEISPQAIINYCWQHKIRIVLPVMHPFTAGHLVFVDYQANTKMQRNMYAIPEPKVSCLSICPLAQIDIVFAPLVAFDQLGNRLGMGGGFYDRTLAPITKYKLKTQIIGLAHDCQLSTQLAHESWDIPLQGVATDTKFFR